MRKFLRIMETNFLIITVVTIIGMSIPLVICCTFFTICAPPKISLDGDNVSTNILEILLIIDIYIIILCENVKIVEIISNLLVRRLETLW